MEISTAMNSLKASTLTINGGSSSIKFAVFTIGEPAASGQAVPNREWRGQISRIGRTDAFLTVTDASGNEETAPVPATDYSGAVDFLVDWFGEQPFIKTIQAVGHRIVHGMEYTEPERITPDLLVELRRIAPIDPDHLPGEIALIEAIQDRYPELVQVACFDTAFHRTLPRVAQLLPIPRRFDAQGVRRYG